MTIRRLFWFVLLPLVLVFVVFPMHLNGYINPHDEGVWLATAQAMLEGKRLYRDIWLQYNPLIPWTVKAVLRMLHPSLSVLRGLFWSLNALGLLAVSVAALRFVRTESLRLLLILFVWMVPSAAFTAMIPMSARYAAGFLPMLFWPLEDTEGEKSARGSGLWAGILAGVAFWIAQEVGTAALVAGAAVFAFDHREKSGLLKYGVGALSILLAGLLFISAYSGLTPYLQAAVFQTAAVVNVERLPLPAISSGWLAQTWAGKAPWITLWEKLAEILALYLPALSLGATLLWSASGLDRFKGWKLTSAGIALYGLMAASSAWGRTDRWHIYFSLTPALLLWAFLADQSLRRGAKSGPSLVFIFLVSGALVTLPPYLGDKLWQAHFKANQRSTSLVRGGSAELPFWQANGYEALVGWIQSHVRPGEPILYFPYNGAIYFLADRPNPTRLPILAYAVRRDMQQQAIHEIDSAHVQWVIWDTENKDFDGIPINRFLSYLSDYLRTHYAERERLGPFIFMEKKA